MARVQTAEGFFARRERELEGYWRRLAQANRQRTDEDLDHFGKLRTERDRLLRADAWEVDAERGGPAFEFAQRRARFEKLLQGRAADDPDLALFVQRELDDRVQLAVLATPAEQLTAYLMFGCFNECPCPPDQLPVLEAWSRRVGARLVYAGRDSLELEIARPPVDSQALVPLAWEHYLFCNDAVDQGAGDLESLAEVLAGRRRWFFWWD